MKINTEDYVCSICGKRNVKLWRPYMQVEPLICAECAEKKQAPYEYLETVWDGHEGKVTGKKLPLPKWKVNAEGKVPAYSGPVPKEFPQPMTDQLIVNLSDNSTSRATMIPACPDECGDFWGYTSVPEEVCKWWNGLPTR